jgi:hypothetical protein
MESDPDRFAQTLQNRGHPFRTIAMDGHDALAFFDPVADPFGMQHRQRLEEASDAGR